ncbi:hypothetical protein BD414DRAFT_540922 [Trametes punicea]|nr:hypothetical protein BD414DRAFT_540922 [Trametes punicea]
MSSSALTRPASAKGKKAATPAQLRAAAREELSALFASTPGGSIAGEEEYADFARQVLAQLDMIGNANFTKEVAHQAVQLVRETIGFASGVESEGVVTDIPWTHPLYHQPFVQIQAELAVEHEDADEPSSVGEVEAEVAEVGELTGDHMENVEEVPLVSRTCTKRKDAPRSIHGPGHKPAAKVMVSTPKRALPTDESTAAPSPRKKARTKLLVFSEPVWRPTSTEPSPSIRCSYCTSHPTGGRCVLCKGFIKGGKKPFGDWYDGKGHSRAIRMDGVVAAKVIKSRGWSSDLPGWVKKAWEMYRSVQKALRAAGEGSPGDSTASEGSRPPLTKSTKGAASTRTPKDTPSIFAGSVKLSHIEISVPCVHFATPAGPSSSSQPAASSSARATPPPSLPSPVSVTPPTTHLPHPATLCTASPFSAPRPPSVPSSAADAPLTSPSFRTPADAFAILLPPTPQQLVLRELVEREMRWFCNTFVRHIFANLSRPQDSAPFDPQCTPAGNAYIRALENIHDALSGQVAALTSVRDEMRIRARNAPLSDTEIVGHYANR